MTMALDREEEVAVAAPKVEEKVQQQEPEAVASDVKCDDPDEDEVTKLLEGDNKEEEPEEGEGEEADSSDVTIGSALASDKSCDGTKMEEEATKPQEGTVEEKESARAQKPASLEKPASLATMEDSPILGVLSKAEASEPIIEKAQDASLEDHEVCAEWSPVMEMADEINEEAIKEDACTTTGETDHSPEEILPTAVEEDETSEEVGLAEVKEGAAGEMPRAELAGDETSEEDKDDGLAELTKGATDEMLQAELVDNETSEEDGLAELKAAVDEMRQAELADDETSEEDDLAELKAAVDEMREAELADDETCEEDEEEDLAELKEGASTKMPQGELTDVEASEEDEEWDSDDAVSSEEYSTEESDEEADETSDESDTADVVQKLQGTVIAEEVNEDASTEDDDFSSDLPPEFDNVLFSDSETESDITAPVLEENQAVVASATKTAVKSLDDSAITEERKEEVSDGADATEKAMKEVDNIVKSLDEFTIKEEEAMEEMQKLPQVENFESMSLRKLKSTYKERLIASKDGKAVAEGKRLPLEEVDENASVDC